MIMNRHILMATAAVAAIGLAACGEAPPPPAPKAGPLPPQLCDQARQGLEKMSASGTFEYSSDGQATIEEAVWLPMAPAQRDALAQALAFHTACASAEPARETSVTIKNEGGRVRSQRVVKTTADLMKALEE